MVKPRILIAGTHSGVGKTTVTLALMAAFRARGRRVQPFKVGPDFIDPGHHSVVCGRQSRNLDGWMLGPELNREIFLLAARDADLSIIEGMMGLFDGSSAVGDKGSAAELAKYLQAPVLLVIDGSAMARSAAAMAYGYAKFDQALHMAGVVFNRVNSPGHYQLLKEAVEKEAGIPVLGYLRSDPGLSIPDRHLGLRTALEEESPQEFYRKLGQAVADTVDLEHLEQLGSSCGEFGQSSSNPQTFRVMASKNRVRIGVAYDRAFCFYYPENLELLEAHGAELIRFSPIRDTMLPDVEVLYVGGGYPELHAEALANNAVMREAIREFGQEGHPIYAECGGMMYLTSAIRDFDGRRYDMANLFPAEAVMNQSGLRMGYREIELTRDCVVGQKGVKARGHEFHYSSLAPTGSLAYACRMTDARGVEKGQDGLVSDNIVALYSHIHFASEPSLAQALVDAGRRCRLARPDRVEKEL